MLLLGDGPLGEGAGAVPEDRVADLQAGHAFAHGGDGAGELDPDDGLLRRPEAEAGEAQEVRGAGEEVEGGPAQAGGLDLHEDLARARSGDGDAVAHLEDVGRAVAVADDGAHRGRGRRDRSGGRFGEGRCGGHGMLLAVEGLTA